MQKHSWFILIAGWLLSMMGTSHAAPQTSPVKTITEQIAAILRAAADQADALGAAASEATHTGIAIQKIEIHFGDIIVVGFDDFIDGIQNTSCGESSQPAVIHRLNEPRSGEKIARKIEIKKGNIVVLATEDLHDVRIQCDSTTVSPSPETPDVPTPPTETNESTSQPPTVQTHVPETISAPAPSSSTQPLLKPSTNIPGDI